MSDECPIYHLLMPKEFRVWCIHNRPPGPKMNVTTRPSKCNCVTCLTNYRYAHGKKAVFKLRWTDRYTRTNERRNWRNDEPPLSTPANFTARPCRATASCLTRPASNARSKFLSVGDGRGGALWLATGAEREPGLRDGVGGAETATEAMNLTPHPTRSSSPALSCWSWPDAGPWRGGDQPRRRSVTRSLRARTAAAGARPSTTGPATPSR